MHEALAQPGAGIERVSVIGAGLIGRSWAALFAAAGMSVSIYDPRPDTDEVIDAFWDSVRPELIELGLVDPQAERPRFRVCASAGEAIEKAEFIQECIPERLDAKRQLYLEIEPHLEANAVVATSSSGFKLSDLQALWSNPGRLIIAHPFNPPHIVPLVELYVNDQSDRDVLPVSKVLYERCGKVTITLKREVMAHVANRLQAALWREAIHLVNEEVATLEDVDKAIWAGPGLRWAVMGPHMLLNLGGGDAGIRAYCQQFANSYAEWWEDLGKPDLSDETIERLVSGLDDECAGRDYSALKAERDAKLVAVLRALKDTERRHAADANHQNKPISTMHQEVS